MFNKRDVKIMSLFEKKNFNPKVLFFFEKREK